MSVGACTSGGCYIILPLHKTLHSCTSLVVCHGQVKCDSVFMTVLDLTDTHYCCSDNVTTPDNETLGEWFL